MLVHTYLRILGDHILDNSWEEIRTVLALGNHLRWEWEGERRGRKGKRRGRREERGKEGGERRGRREERGEGEERGRRGEKIGGKTFC